MASSFLFIISLVIAGLGILIGLILIYRLLFLSRRLALSNNLLPKGEWLLLAIVMVLALQGIGSIGSGSFPQSASSLTTAIFTYLAFLVWPLFYFYFVSISSKTSGKIKHRLLHLLLPILLLLPVLKLSSLAEKYPTPPNPGNSTFRKERILRMQGPQRSLLAKGPRFRAGQPARQGFFPFNSNNRPARGFSSIWRYRQNQILLQSQLFLFFSNGIPPQFSSLFAQHLLPDVNFPFFSPSSIREFSTWNHIVDGGNLLYAWIYLLLMVFLAMKYSKKITFRSTSGEKKNLIWMISLLIIMGIIQTIILFFFVSSITSLRFFLTHMFSRSVPIPLFYLSAILVYLVLHRRKNGQEKEYGKNGLDPEIMDRYFTRVLEYMEKNQPYRDETLALKQVADHVQIHPNVLSQIINKKQKCNFKDFINSFRVDEVKRELLNPKNQHKNILAVALESGFNCKSSFNLIFKKHTGLTPSQFLKRDNLLHSS